MENPALTPIVHEMTSFTRTATNVTASAINNVLIAAERSSRSMRPLELVTCLCLAEQVEQTAQRDRDPVGPVVQLVVQLVEHLLEHRQLERRPELLRARRHEPLAARFLEVCAKERGRDVDVPERGPALEAR